MEKTNYKLLLTEILNDDNLEYIGGAKLISNYGLNSLSIINLVVKLQDLLEREITQKVFFALFEETLDKIVEVLDEEL